MHHASALTSSPLARTIAEVPPVRSATDQFTLIKQESRVTEFISDPAGMQKEAHVVIKGQPFTVILQTRALSFHGFRLEASLLYETTREAVVLMEGGCPLCFSSEVSQGDGREIRISLKIKVLSSHYAGQYFAVRLRGLHPLSNQLVPGLQIDTQPIRVVSKPASCIPTNQRGKRGAPNPLSVAVAPTAQPHTLLTKVNEILEVQQAMLGLLEAKKGGNKRKRPSAGTNGCEPDCFAAFQQFARAYEATADTDRPTKLRKITTEFPQLVQELLKEALPNLDIPKGLGPGLSAPCGEFSLPWDTMFGPDEAGHVEFLKNQYKSPEVVGSLNDTLEEWLHEASL